MSLRNKGKDLMTGPEVDLTLHLIHLLFISLIRIGLSGRVAVKKLFLKKANWGKRLKYVKFQKNWNESQWNRSYGVVNPNFIH